MPVTEAPQPTLRGWRLLGAALAVVIVAAVLAAVAATPASASVVSKCSGTLIDYKYFSWDGISHAGRVELYYKDGYNCAMTRDYLPGKAKMQATLYVCGDNSPSGCDNDIINMEVTAAEWWYGYSDGARLRAAGRCVRFEGYYDRRGGAHVYAGRGWGHCN